MHSSSPGLSSPTLLFPSPLFEEDKDLHPHLAGEEMKAWEELVNRPMFQSIRSQ